MLHDHLRIYGEPLATGVMLLLGLLPLFAPTRADDVLVRFARMGALAGVAYLFVLPEYTQVRLGLVLLPFSAIGVGRIVAWWTALGESSRAEIAEPRLTGRRRPEVVPTFS